MLQCVPPPAATGCRSDGIAASTSPFSVLTELQSLLASDIPQANAPHLHFLVVDDDAISHVLLEHIFASYAAVTCLTSGELALPWLATHHVDMILLDYCLPGMDGLEVLRRIRRSPELANIPVIMITGTLDGHLEAEGFATGATDFVRKPFVPDAVVQRVRKVLHYEYLQKYLKNEVQRQTQRAEYLLKENRRMFRQVTKSLARAIDAKDRYTAGHSQRVANYARIIAARSGESKELVHKIYFAGLLHDIGKIGIPGAIINKPSKLSEDEYKTMQSHTVIGHEILKSVVAFPELALCAYAHHERYDGSGYPQGLKAKETPKMARILAVADAYDAMTSQRSYRAPLAQDKVRSELLKGRSRQFDPQYADIMLSLMAADKAYRMRERPSRFAEVRA